MEASLATMTKRLHLWEITAAEEELAEKLMACGGELTPELEREWESLEGSFDAKAERIALYVRELTANANTALTESARLRELHDVYANRAKYLKEYLQFHMEKSGRTKVETPRARMWVQKNGGRPSIYWQGLPETLPSKFQRVTVTLNGEAAQQAYENNELPEGFVVKPVGTHLRIS